MKNANLLLIIIGLGLIFTFVGCDDNYYYDDVAPSPPRNITTITGDNRVDIFWDRSPERDVAGYNVYYSYSFEGEYTLIGNTPSTSYIDYGARNGVTYYYAVTSYDYDGNESELSYDVVYDTPRPEGFNQAIFDYNRSPNNSGYHFRTYSVVPYNGDDADFFFENYNGTFYLNVWDDTDIQDMGTTNNIWDISYAPSIGWVSLVPGENVKYVEARIGRTYVIWTWDNHYAKIRISNITPERMVFDWAYQLVEGERELKSTRADSKRKKVPNEIFRTQ